MEKSTINIRVRPFSSSLFRTSDEITGCSEWNNNKKSGGPMFGMKVVQNFVTEKYMMFGT